jgi:tetratricopeptide (TPR) repeat protein
MTTGRHTNYSLWMPWIFLAPLLIFLLNSCGPPKKPEGMVYIKKQDIPRRVAVLPVRYIPKKEKKTIDLEVAPDSEKGKFIAELVRGVFQNQLAGKGYVVLPIEKVDQKFETAKEVKDWQSASPERICKTLGVDGLIYPEISSATMIKLIAYDEYSIEAQLKMVNIQGENLGTWKDSASKKKIATPTSILGVAATLLEAAMDESERKHMRLVVYDLGYKISEFIPENPQEKALPQVMSVSTNVDKGTFAAGEQVEVEVTAEEDLTCTFDLGDFKKEIPMSAKEGGNYKGVYFVREDDKASMVPIQIRLVKPNGVERLWIETGGTVTIDAIAPPPPGELKAVSSKQGISLSWILPQTEDLNEFVVERNDKPVGDFTPLTKTKDLTYLDQAVTQGGTYYYRVRSVDSIGNQSSPTKIADVTMPFFEEIRLAKEVKGVLVPGVYLLEGESVVPKGEVLKIGPASRLKFSSGGRLAVKGVLQVNGKQERSTMFEGDGWQGVHVAAEGRAELSNTSIRGCAPCIVDDGGFLGIQSVSVHGKEGDGVKIGSNSVFEVSDIQVSGCQKGLVLDGGKGKIQGSTFTGNKIGVEFISGNVELVDNNILENKEKEVLSRGKLILYGNYLGAANVKDLRLEGDILVKSLLDAPYPHGRKVVLVDEKEITPDVIQARFQKYKEQGIQAFTNRKFGDAHQALSKAMQLKDDKQVFIYMAYTLMILGEEANLEKTLQKGIEAFPYEIRLYQVYAKHLAAKGRKKEALSLLEKASRMNPDDQAVKIMKASLVETPKPATVAPKKVEAVKTDKERFDKLKSQGIEAFKKKDFKEASKDFSEALSMKDDREAYLYQAYTQMNLGDNPGLEKTLERGIKAFPEEVRLYQVYVRHLASTGEIEKAMSLVKKGLEMKPGDRNLNFLKEYLEGMKK